MKPLILMYHRVAQLSTVGRNTVSPCQFKEQMRYLIEHNHTTIGLNTLVDWINGLTNIPERSVIITFDDGFLDTYEHALPVLKELGFSATFFVISGLLGKTNTWMTQTCLDRTPLMNLRQVQSLRSAGFEVGSHSEFHPDLTTIDCNAVKVELATSKQILEDLLSERVNYFAYPYGRYDVHIKQYVLDVGYRAACATAPGFVQRNVDLYQLPRIEIEGKDTLAAFARKITFGVGRFTRFDLMRYYGERLTAKAFRHL